MLGPYWQTKWKFYDWWLLPINFLCFVVPLLAFSTWCFRSFSVANRFGQTVHSKGFNCEYLTLCTATWWSILPLLVVNLFEQNVHLKGFRSESISRSPPNEHLKTTRLERFISSKSLWTKLNFPGSFYLYFTRPCAYKWPENREIPYVVIQWSYWIYLTNS